jgi:hypothetical protein
MTESSATPLPHVSISEIRTLRSNLLREGYLNECYDERDSFNAYIGCLFDRLNVSKKVRLMLDLLIEVIDHKDSHIGAARDANSTRIRELQQMNQVYKPSYELTAKALHQVVELTEERSILAARVKQLEYKNAKLESDSL